MRVSGCVLVLAVVAWLAGLPLSLGPSSRAAAQSLQVDLQSDQLAAQRALGPQWKQLSRRAGMIFAGTVVATVAHSGADHSVADQTVADQSGSSQAFAMTPATAVQLRFRVDEPIAGVKRGQMIALNEWAGAASMRRPMNPGQRVLLFLYPPSRLGLSSPVGGPLGQFALDPTGTKLAAPADADTNAATVPVVQLERAIRRARAE